jgi:hypothetical protein
MAQTASHAAVYAKGFMLAIRSFVEDAGFGCKFIHRQQQGGSTVLPIMDS